MNETTTNASSKRSLRSYAWFLILIADAGLLAWGAMAALAPNHLQGPGGTPILTAEYESFTGNSWSELMATNPRVGDFITIIFRMYGTFNVAFGLMGMMIAATAFRSGERWAWWALLIGNTMTYVSAMVFDKTMNAIGIFELTEYLGLAVVYVALAATVRYNKVRRPGFSMG